MVLWETLPVFKYSEFIQTFWKLSWFSVGFTPIWLRNFRKKLSQTLLLNSSMENCRKSSNLHGGINWISDRAKRILLVKKGFLLTKNVLFVKIRMKFTKKKISLEKRRSCWNEKDLARSKKILKEVKRSSLAKKKDFAQRVIWIFTSKMTFIVHSK